MHYGLKMNKKEVQQLYEDILFVKTHLEELQNDFLEMLKLRKEEQDEIGKKVSDLECFKKKTVDHQVTILKELKGLKKEVDTLTQALAEISESVTFLTGKI